MTPLEKSDGPIPCSALIEGAIVSPIDHGTSSRDAVLLSHGALCIDESRIIAIGEYAELAHRFDPAERYGSKDHLILPGFINAHDHVRAPSTLELGVPDDLLEVWIMNLMRLPDLDPESVSALAHCEMLEAGVTTVVNSFYQPTANRYDATLAAMLTGAQHARARAVVAMSTLDDSIIGALLGDVRPQLPSDLGKQTDIFLSSRKTLSMSEYADLVRSWSARSDFDRTSFIMGPVSAHWCSDALLDQLWDLSTSLDLPIQTHLLESAYQKNAANARYGRSIVSFMNDAGLLNARLSCAHCVFATPADIELLAAAKVSVIHCPGSNLRLQNGVAPIAAMIKHGVNVGFGIDSMGLKDDSDMLNEMRLAHDLHLDGTNGAPLLSKATLLNMATRNGARAIGMEDQIGALEIGKLADIAVYAPQQHDNSPLAKPSLDALFGGGDQYGVDLVFVDGELVVRNGRHEKIDRTRLHAELIQSAKTMLRSNEALNDFTRALDPFIRRLVSKRT